MFTKKFTSLREFDGIFGVEMLRDCQFSYVGKVPTRLDARLVSCSKESHIQEALQAQGIAGIVCTRDLVELVPDHLGVAVASSPLNSLHEIHKSLCDRTDFFWETFKTEIDPSATIHPSACIAEFNVIIGAQCHVGPFALIEERSIIKDRCKIGPHCVIGGEGFDVDANQDNPRVLPHAGGVMIDENVEMQSHCVIARSTFGGFTTIGASTKLDCLIVVTHDAILGRNVVIAGGATICGRVKVGDNVVIGPQSVVSNGVTVGDGASITIGAVVTRDVSANEKVTGNLAVPHSQWMRFLKSIT